MCGRLWKVFRRLHVAQRIILIFYRYYFVGNFINQKNSIRGLKKLFFFSI